ncbi:hypothetical protein D3C76_1038920 [compost metagenome]
MLRVGGEAHLGVLLVALEDERPGAHRLAVQLLRLAGPEQRIGIFRRIDGGEAHGQVGEEGRLGMAQGEAHGVRIELVDALDQRGEAHRLGIGEAARRQCVPGMRRVELALEAPQHVVGVEFAARGEPAGRVEFHAPAQVEGVGQAVGADLPALRQCRDYVRAAGGELHQAFEHGFRHGVGGGGGGVLDDVETFRAGLGAHHQALAEGRRTGEHAGQGECVEQAAECVLHGAVSFPGAQDL